ncbi:hypothetical protein TNCV_271911 [Trichonephila clavipes]|nr:hypothetical protein TNCV_271911 [Trichonephila clavipes]
MAAIWPHDAWCYKRQHNCEQSPVPLSVYTLSTSHGLYTWAHGSLASPNPVSGSECDVERTFHHLAD